MTKDKMAISTCRNCSRIIKHRKGTTARCTHCISGQPVPEIIPLRRTEKQHYQDGGYHEEDYQQLLGNYTKLMALHSRFEAVYSVQSVNAMFERAAEDVDKS